MASIEDVLTEWKTDCTIDECAINKELMRGPFLHSKYLDYYVYFKAKHSNAEKKYNRMMWVKRKYFRGEMEQAELQQYGWSQWQGLKPSSSEINQLFEMDKELNDLKEMVNSHKTSVTAIEYIMKQIQGRDWAIKSLIEYNRYVGGN